MDLQDGDFPHKTVESLKSGEPKVLAQSLFCGGGITHAVQP